MKCIGIELSDLQQPIFLIPSLDTNRDIEYYEISANLYAWNHTQKTWILQAKMLSPPMIGLSS